jgi:hypothetical protein
VVRQQPSPYQDGSRLCVGDTQCLPHTRADLNLTPPGGNSQHRCFIDEKTKILRDLVTGPIHQLESGRAEPPALTCLIPKSDILQMFEHVNNCSLGT